jgi:hypothetical protein
MAPVFSSRADMDAAHRMASTRVFDRTLRSVHDLATLAHDQVGTLSGEALTADRSDDRADEAAAVAAVLRQLADSLENVGRDVRPTRLSAAA